VNTKIDDGHQSYDAPALHSSFFRYVNSFSCNLRDFVVSCNLHHLSPFVWISGTKHVAGREISRKKYSTTILFEIALEIFFAFFQPLILFCFFYGINLLGLDFLVYTFFLRIFRTHRGQCKNLVIFFLKLFFKHLIFLETTYYLSIRQYSESRTIFIIL